jgi:flagellar hook-associated protein FlgK
VISGGKIGGLLRYRDDVLAPAINELGRTAMVVADAINQQLGQGLDANGEFGSSLFNNINSDKAISQRSLAATGNIGSGNLNVSIADSGALTTYDYQVTFSSDNDYTVKRSDGTGHGRPSTSPKSGHRKSTASPWTSMARARLDRWRYVQGQPDPQWREAPQGRANDRCQQVGVCRRRWLRGRGQLQQWYWRGQPLDLSQRWISMAASAPWAQRKAISKGAMPVTYGV